ncbi:malto-oligosyltrehalose synthase [Corynebacterium guangdongense]|uniref:(1->4)-alpha-D-glucan 1-alpha-D-glucosylmutase n=1 Tax=Corynebacterium guangdongense TaxID=1783348 RepID=A0ABU1ZXN6_9CORY|nr:malto-oligosyltrehalose synthase [Corynebacterium guangdongense]MDR7329702.1 (1->4)-alpha-D-glucan 1-alpha-D-glucosylmutase [Corynebacterium guangdongense]WJZ18266.1 Maltooligosyl trehalose synthase [Corynebacterium guangdongense]
MRRPITATYRLQLRGPQADEMERAFTFQDAADLVPYLQKLGVSHLYLSPIFTAQPESNHGYDVIDPTEINPELGGMEGLRTLAEVAREAGLGLIIDIVPNHLSVAVPKRNKWWWDVLKNGRDSEFETYFDIDWHEDNGADGKLGLPVFGSPDDEDKLALEHDEDLDEIVLAYYEHKYPIRPGTCEGLEDDPVEVYGKQCYKLMYWRAGVISYRRFFSVNELAGIRQEDPLVFEHTHRILRTLIAEDLIDGVRVDHPDGLSDPFEYLNRLRNVIGPDRWLIAEKILAETEPLDPRLAVDGTTGYDALREFDGIFINRDAEDSMSILALQQSGSTWDEESFVATEQQLKREVAAAELAAEIRRLVRAIRRDNFSTAGHSVSDEDLTGTIIELVAATPVYRADYLSLSRVTATNVAEMARRFPSRRDALDLISAALLVGGEAKIRFAQVCGAVMAKGVEDTTFYRACRLIALQEVGGAPGRFGLSPAEFHLNQQERANLWPRSQTTLSTHDTKRSEDVRARIIELTEHPNAFGEIVRRVTAQVPAPDAAAGHFLLQNLIGVWPVDGEFSESLKQRVRAYAVKAMREAAVRTSWFDPDQQFEDAITDWLDALADGPLTTEITRFLQPVHRGAVLISLGRKMLQIIGPGIPDVYQGQEFFDDSLVDPDNRRFVDYTARSQTLELLTQGYDWCRAAETARDGLPEGHQDQARTLNSWYPHIFAQPDLAKLHVLHEALKVRREFPDIFGDGDYQAVFAEGPADGQLVGMARGYANAPSTDELSVVALATRRPWKLAKHDGWRETTLTLPKGEWTDRLTGRSFSGTILVSEVLDIFPTALLVADRIEGIPH